MRLALLACTISALLVCAVYADDEVEPGAKIRERATRDAEALLPQKGTGGTATGQIDSVESVFREFKVEVEGCEKCKAHVAFQAGMDRSRKHALVVVMTGDGDVDEDFKSVSKLSQGRDPLVLCALTYAEWKEIGEDFVRLENFIDDEKLAEAHTWLMNKVIKEYPIDPERVFLFGLENGQHEATDYARSLWQADPDAFPFRAILIDGQFGGRAQGMPPVPLILSQGVNKAFDMEGSRHVYSFANELLASGVPVQYHEYQTGVVRLVGSDMPARRLMIHRDAIATMGGPGAPEYPPERSMPGVITDADKIPFADSEDRYVREVVNLARQEQLKAAKSHIDWVLNNRNINAREKRELRTFQREFDRWAKSEMERCNKSVEISLNADMWPHHLHLSRLKALAEAYKDDRVVQGKPYHDNLEKVRTFGPAQRDEKRREMLKNALKLELEGNREEAKKLYQELAKQKAEDGGFSDWPFAAEYRLSWWTD